MVDSSRFPRPFRFHNVNPVQCANVLGDSDHPFPGRVARVRRDGPDGRQPEVVQGRPDEGADHARRTDVHAQRQHAHAVL